MLQGMKIYLDSQPFRANKLTVVIESSPDQTDSELIVLQQKGEATENPVVPASRGCCTIFYVVKDGGEHVSSLKLKASTADVQVSIADEHYQIASKSPEWRVLGNLRIDLTQAEGSSSRFGLEVVQVLLHEGHGTATAQAILLAPKNQIEVQDEDGDGDEDEDRWRDWGIKESMSVEDITARADKPGSQFKVVATMDKTIYSVDYEAVMAKEALV